MIKFKLIPQGRLTLSKETFKRFSDTLANAISEVIAELPQHLPDRISIRINPSEGISVELNGFVDHSEGELNWLVRHISPVLKEISIKLFGTSIYISESDSIPQLNDIIFKIYAPTDTLNATKLDGLVPDDKIPDDYLCALSQQMMDDPVYLKNNPRINYNRAHLEHYMYTVACMSDPFTRQGCSYTDIIPNTELKKDIDKFMREKLQEPWFLRSVKHGSLFKDLPTSTNTENLLIRNLERVDDEEKPVLISYRN